LAHRQSHHRDLTTARPPARQARSTREFLNASTNPAMRALLMSQREGFTKVGGRRRLLP
jgi:hypothetical protein